MYIAEKKHIIEGSSFSFMGVTIKKVIPYGKKTPFKKQNAACCDFIVMINWLVKRGEYLRCALVFADFVLLGSGWCRLISSANGCKSKLGSRRRVCSMGKKHRCSFLGEAAKDLSLLLESLFNPISIPKRIFCRFINQYLCC